MFNSNPSSKTRLTTFPGRPSRSRSKVFGPDLALLLKRPLQVDALLMQSGRQGTLKPTVQLENSDRRLRPRRHPGLCVFGGPRWTWNRRSASPCPRKWPARCPKQDRITNIRVRCPDLVRYDREQLERLPISLPVILRRGGQCAAGQAANLRLRPPPPGGLVSGRTDWPSDELFLAENQQPMINVTAGLKNNSDLGAVAGKTPFLRELLPQVTSRPGYRVELAGNYTSRQ